VTQHPTDDGERTVGRSPSFDFVGTEYFDGAETVQRSARKLDLGKQLSGPLLNQLLLTPTAGNWNDDPMMVLLMV
jgi:hypothetical protein